MARRADGLPTPRFKAYKASIKLHCSATSLLVIRRGMHIMHPNILHRFGKPQSAATWICISIPAELHVCWIESLASEALRVIQAGRCLMKAPAPFVTFGVLC